MKYPGFAAPVRAAVSTALCALAVLATPPSLAQGAAVSVGDATVATGSAYAAPSPDDALFQALGGEAGVTRLVDDFVPRFSRDPRFAEQFKKTKMQRFHDTLVQQICIVAGGPCKYTGDPMDEVHKGLKIDKADFNAVVELLQQSMDVQGIAFRTQGQLLAKLAPMHREIVTR